MSDEGTRSSGSRTAVSPPQGLAPTRDHSPTEDRANNPVNLGTMKGIRFGPNNQDTESHYVSRRGRCTRALALYDSPPALQTGGH